jgi:hypothetical protein
VIANAVLGEKGGKIPTDVPKTLIFAKDDNCAEASTGIAREVFGRGNGL